MLRDLAVLGRQRAPMEDEYLIGGSGPALQRILEDRYVAGIPATTSGGRPPHQNEGRELTTMETHSTQIHGEEAQRAAYA
jgi:hypothetical protein